MKKVTAYVLGLAALAATAYVCGQVWAQPAQPTAPPQTRVAFVNVARVFQEYKKAQFLKKEIETIAAPKKELRDKYVKEMKAWSDYMKEHAEIFSPGSPKFEPQKKEQYERGLLNNKRLVEDLDREMQVLLSQKNEQQYIQLYKELNDATQRYAQANNYQVVLAYVEQTTGDTLSITNIMRKVQGMDMGGSITPMFLGGGVDISTAIVDGLNSSYQGPLTKQ